MYGSHSAHPTKLDISSISHIHGPCQITSRTEQPLILPSRCRIAGITSFSTRPPSIFPIPIWRSRKHRNILVGEVYGSELGLWNSLAQTIHGHRNYQHRHHLPTSYSPHDCIIIKLWLKFHDYSTHSWKSLRPNSRFNAPRAKIFRHSYPFWWFHRRINFATSQRLNNSISHNRQSALDVSFGEFDEDWDYPSRTLKTEETHNSVIFRNSSPTAMRGLYPCYFTRRH